MREELLIAGKAILMRWFELFASVVMIRGERFR